VGAGSLAELYTAREFLSSISLESLAAVFKSPGTDRSSSIKGQ
jgi:hypothetical protein